MKDESQTLTAEQVQQYREQGYVTVPGLFSEAELEPIDAYLRANAEVKWIGKNDDPLRESLCELAIGLGKIAVVMSEG